MKVVKKNGLCNASSRYLYTVRNADGTVRIIVNTAKLARQCCPNDGTWTRAPQWQQQDSK